MTVVSRQNTPRNFLSLSTTFLISFATATTWACGPQSVASASTQSNKTGGSGQFQIKRIIGDNDLVAVDNSGSNLPQKYIGLLDAFGRMSMNCTATHLGHGIVVTAGHCFRAASFRENNLGCDQVTVEWGVRGDRPGYLISRCEMVLAQETSDKLDYAIFKVTPAPRAELQVAAQNPVLGQKITLFGHPRGRPLEWSAACEVLSPDLGGWGENAFSHQCDTEAGNSGSAVLDAETAEIVGVHDGGIEPYNYATNIQDTPIAEFEPYYSGREELQILDPEAGDIVFGKLDLGNDRSDKLLVELDHGSSDTTNFTLTVDLEGSYDSVVIVDGSGRRSSRITGRNSYGMTGLKAPVKILFSSDSSGLSSLVKVSKISYQ